MLKKHGCVDDGEYVMLCGVKVGGVNVVEGGGKVEWLILRCWGVLVTDRQTDVRTDIGDCRVAFATEKSWWIQKYATVAAPIIWYLLLTALSNITDTTTQGYLCLVPLSFLVLYGSWFRIVTVKTSTFGLYLQKKT